MAELVIVGCSGSGPGPRSAASAYLVRETVEGRTTSVLLDLGSGAFGPLQGLVDPRDIDAIVLSHLHADHCLDMVAWDVAATYGPGPWGPVPTYAPAGTQERLARAGEVDDPRDAHLDRSFDFRTIDAQSRVTVGCFTMTFAPAAHPVESYAIRVDGPHGALVYSGDTGPTPALDELARGANLLLAEASFPDRADLPPDLHLSGRQAGECADGAGVGTLVVTHVPAWEDAQARVAEARGCFDGTVVLAEPGLVVAW